MADLTGDDRGQIILIAAFILAVAFVVLALVVNSAIFTENLATRDNVAGSQDALQYRAEIEASVGNHIEAVNDNNSVSLAGAEDSIPNVSTQGGFQQSSLGRVVNISFEDNTTGEKVAQDDASDFGSNESLDFDWTVASSVTDTRNLRINVTDKDALEEEPTVDPLTDADQFRIHVTDGSDFWNVSIYENTTLTDSPVKVRVERNESGSSAVSEVCIQDVSEPFTIDVTAARVAGEYCHALDTLQDGTEMWFASSVSGSYDINFENANNIEGTYSFIVDDGATFDSSKFNATHPDAPYHTEAIYSMTVSYAYYTPSVAYETEITAAPEEAPP